MQPMNATAVAAATASGGTALEQLPCNYVYNY
jgi:hypothetical protein